MALNPNSRYPTKTNAPSAGYPLGSARNVTVSGDGTGTPWEQDLVNDIWGFLQELIDKASITASGNADKVGVSQYYDAVRLTAGHPGLWTPLSLNASPSSFGIRILLLDGSGVSVTAYPDLVAATYVGNSANPTAPAFYKADDAAGTIRNTSGAYLILPDARGRTLRGLDVTGTIDPDGASRALGGEQLDAVQRHNHVVQNDTYVPGTPLYPEVVTIFENTGSTAGVAVVAPTTGNLIQASAVNIGEDIPGGFTNVTGVGRVDSETRSRNIAVNWGIWY